MQSALLCMSMLLAPALGTLALERYGGALLWIGMGLLGFVSVAWLAIMPSPHGVPDAA